MLILFFQTADFYELFCFIFQDAELEVQYKQVLKSMQFGSSDLPCKSESYFLRKISQVLDFLQCSPFHKETNHNRFKMKSSDL